MFDIGMLQSAAKRAMKKGPQVAIEIEAHPGKPSKGMPPKGDPDAPGDELGELAEELRACADEYGQEPAQLLAEFKKFLASKGKSHNKMPEDEPESAPDTESPLDG
ncbi:MAG: hypothetical protein FJ100_16245 [Deltaproteobacteria bacterium]|nr:hypothetical protein [Deltaproteobacteria bacterium]